MRVAFFVWHFPLVSETFVLNMARAVIEAGHELDIYSLWRTRPQDAIDHPLIARYGLLARHRKAVAPESLVRRLAGAPGAFLRVARHHGLRAALRLTPPFARDRRALGLRPLFEAAAVTDGRYDVIHCQFSSIAPQVQRLREAGVLKGALIVHVRGADVAKSGKPERRAGYARAFAAAGAVIANSRHFGDAAVAAGCPAGKITVIPSAADLGALPYRAPTRPEGRRVRLLAVGRLVEKKGLRFAIDAVARLVAGGRDVGLDIIGDGPLRDALAAQIVAQGMADRVRLLGAQPSDAVQRALTQADIFVASSVTAADGDQDAATNTVKEAMATGVPVVASRHGGMPEMVLDGETGLLAAEGDAVALADALARLIDAPQDWPRLAEAARAKVAAEASSDVLDGRLLALYAAVAKSAA